MLETVIGSIGFVLLLAAFFLNLIGKMSRQGAAYAILNLTGAGTLAWYAFMKDAAIFVALESVWSLTAGGTLLVLIWGRRQSPIRR
jgi:hypothetical protein